MSHTMLWSESVRSCSDALDELAVWRSRNDVVNAFPIRGPGTVECTKRASLWDGE